MSDPKLQGHVPADPLEEKWQNYLNTCKLVNPNNKRKHTVLVVGTGLAGASAAATLAELGYNVKAFCIQDSARRAHSIAAQGGINAELSRRWRFRLAALLRYDQGWRLSVA